MKSIFVFSVVLSAFLAGFQLGRILEAKKTLEQAHKAAQCAAHAEQWEKLAINCAGKLAFGIYWPETAEK